MQVFIVWSYLVISETTAKNLSKRNKIIPTTVSNQAFNWIQFEDVFEY